MKRIIGACLLSALLVSVSSPAIGGTLIRISGGGAAVAGFVAPCLESYEEASGNRATLRETSAGEALVDLEKGRADLVVAAMPFSRLFREARKIDSSVDMSNYEQVLVGSTSTVVIVNRQNLTAEVSRKQLRSIFSGAITNWKQLGGADLPIEIIWGSQTTEQNKLFNDQVLDGEAVSASAVIVKDYGDIRSEVTKRPGAIGLNPAGYVSGLIRVVRTAPRISSDVIAVMRREGPREVYSLLDFIRKLLVSMEVD